MRNILLWGGIGLALLLVVGLGLFEYRHQQGVQRAALAFARQQVEPLGDIGSTGSLRILPLLDFHSADPNLETAVGVSYLVDTDDHRILFDVGQNPEGSSPSPLQKNMAALGVDLASVDTVFISHNHFDHVGGLHFPVPEGRIKIGPLDGQRHFASGEGLFNPISMEEVERQIAMLKARDLGIIGVSGHDSSDEVIEMVRRAFGGAYRDVRVGEAIIVAASR